LTDCGNMAAMAGHATKVKKATATNSSCIKLDSLKRRFARKARNASGLIELSNFDRLNSGDRLATTNLHFPCADSRWKSLILLLVICIERGTLVVQRL
jgi:hypothetical protein